MKTIEQLRADIKARIIDVYENMGLDDIEYNYGIAEGLLMAYSMLFDGPMDSAEIYDVSNETIKRLSRMLIERYS